MLADDEKTLGRILDQYGISAVEFPGPHSAVTITAVTPQYGLVAIVAFGNYSNTTMIEVISTFFHEAVHVQQAVFRYVGGSDFSDETEAYGIEYYGRYLLKEYLYRKQKKLQTGRLKKLQTGRLKK
jgi:hypothetical protein